LRWTPFRTSRSAARPFCLAPVDACLPDSLLGQSAGIALAAGLLSGPAAALPVLCVSCTAWCLLALLSSGQAAGIALAAGLLTGPAAALPVLCMSCTAWCLLALPSAGQAAGFALATGHLTGPAAALSVPYLSCTSWYLHTRLSSRLATGTALAAGLLYDHGSVAHTCCWHERHIGSLDVDPSCPDMLRQFRCTLERSLLPVVIAGGRAQACVVRENKRW
jgi:hypothetical protein